MAYKSILGTVCACLMVVSFNSNAILIGRLAATEGSTDYQAYYDTDADLTWLADAYADYQRSLTPAKSWATNLDVDGVTGWRLPDADPSCAFEYNCADSEIANLFYNVLGNTAGSLTNTGPFFDVRTGYYWLDSGIRFSMGSGQHGGLGGFNVTLNAWAVHSGDVEPPLALPIPSTLWLFGSGLLGLGLVGVARRKKA